MFTKSQGSEYSWEEFLMPRENEMFEAEFQNFFFHLLFYYRQIAIPVSPGSVKMHI